MKLAAFSLIVALSVCAFIVQFSEPRPNKLKVAPHIEVPKQTENQKKFQELIKRAEEMTGMKGSK